MKAALRKFLQERICTKITPALQFLLLINISVALFFYLFDIISGIDLHFYFSAYPTYSPHFHYYQLVTFMLVHSIDPLHIVSNVLFLLVFSANVEKKIGFHSFIIAYFVCAWVGYIFINQAYSINKIQIEKRIISTGISPEKIPINDRHQVADMGDYSAYESSFGESPLLNCGIIGAQAALLFGFLQALCLIH